MSEEKKRKRKIKEPSAVVIPELEELEELEPRGVVAGRARRAAGVAAPRPEASGRHLPGGPRPVPERGSRPPGGARRGRPTRPRR